MEIHVESRHQQRGHAIPARPMRAGFSLIDLLISIAIIALLIAISLPYMSGVREQARRLKCGVNLRSIGTALLQYATDHDEHIPTSVFLGPSPDGSDDYSAQMNHARVFLIKNRTPAGAIVRGPSSKSVWDGLGALYAGEYLTASSVFYCPSHHGDNPYERYAKDWSGGDTDILANYQYRGRGPKGVRRLDRIVATAALVSDGLSSVDEYNHNVGTNVLRAGSAVEWVGDRESSSLASQLEPQPVPQGGSVGKLWNALDAESQED